MSDLPSYEDEPQLQPRSPFPHARPGPIPDFRLENMLEERVASLVVRHPSNTDSSSTGTFSCGPKDTTGPCERNTSSTDNTTLPIVLGVLIPLGVAFIAMFILHRRNLKKQRLEDMEDKHKSLDFGLGAGGPLRKAVKGKKGRNIDMGPEMSALDAHDVIKKNRGLSMDMNLGSPYLLPPELQQSRESLHSLSRTFNTGDDKYGRTDFIPDDGSIRSPSSLRRTPDDSSSFTGSSRPRFDSDASKRLKGAPSVSSRGNVPAIIHNSSPDPGMPPKPLPPAKDNLLAPVAPDGRDSFVSTTSSNGANNAFRKSNDYLGAFIRGGGGFGLGIGTEKKEDAKKAEPSVTEIRVDPAKEQPLIPPPAIIKNDEELGRKRESVYSNEADPQAHPHVVQETSDRQPRLPQLSFLDPSRNKQQSSPEISVTDLSDGPESKPQSTQPSRRESHQYNQGYQEPVNQSQHDSQQYIQSRGESTNQSRQGSQQYLQSNGTSANQSRQPSQQYDRQYSQQYDQQYQDYNHHYSSQSQDHYYEQEQYDEEDYYDPAEEYDYYDPEDLDYDPRRLTWGMRPLPPDDPSENPEQRANRIRSFYKEYFDAPNGSYGPQYYDGSESYDDYYGNEAYYAPRGYSSQGRHRATFSHGSYGGPRAYSSASGRYGRPGPGPRARMAPKKKLPPPKALNILPTPSKLKDDSFILDMAVDFAPPNRAVLQRSGTPDSLRGGKRPYSPTVRAHIPLTSSFDDLAAMPSPHALRKSGTFTGLDFAPPRFRAGGDSMSETGSIRSNRSGISAMHQHNIRTGAYRISRIPKEVAGTKHDILASLKPKWDMTH